MKKSKSFGQKFYESIIRMPKKTLNALTITTNIIMFIIFISLLIFKEDFISGLYWIFIHIYIVVDFLNIVHWDYDGLKADKKKSDNIVAKYRDMTALTMVLSMLFFVLVLFFESIKFDVMGNLFVMISLYILLAVSQLFNQVSIYSAKKETAKLAESISGKKNK